MMANWKFYGLVNFCVCVLLLLQIGDLIKQIGQLLTMLLCIVV